MAKKSTIPTVTLISTEEAGRRLGYTSQYVRDLIRLGRIRGQQIGRILAVEAESLEGFSAKKPGRPKRSA
jgi:excisionase family DNA binding protein